MDYRWCSTSIRKTCHAWWTRDTQSISNVRCYYVFSWWKPDGAIVQSGFHREMRRKMWIIIDVTTVIISNRRHSIYLERSNHHKYIMLQIEKQTRINVIIDIGRSFLDKSIFSFVYKCCNESFDSIQSIAHQKNERERERHEESVFFLSLLFLFSFYCGNNLDWISRCMASFIEKILCRSLSSMLIQQYFLFCEWQPKSSRKRIDFNINRNQLDKTR
jgi:hypothetical protein